ncbi:mitochondrial inner membrane protein OXA1L isoform X2 [Microplitis mediator]|uniref:mitochondrial inner membrane protein OXA1L isoform X2 n=1 Tax=Microplitis mediator TaxID=375433 RepID=UPI002552DD80|nr:mitochondrial inner membrane protein OXA1L isoform X2 [Microplitis mediator]
MLSRAAVCINNRVLSKTHVISQKFMNRSMHVACRSVTSKLRLNLSRKSTPAICSSFVRGINTDGAEVKNVTGESVNKITENVTPATGPLEAIPDGLIDLTPASTYDPVKTIFDAGSAYDRIEMNFLDTPVSRNLRNIAEKNSVEVPTAESLIEDSSVNLEDVISVIENFTDSTPVESSANVTDSIPVITETVETTPANNLIDAIPDVPIPPPVTIEEIVSVTNALGEPTLKSLGLAGWSPIGIVQQLLEVVHVSCGLPWWATIALGTVCVRTLLFPLVVISQRNAANLHNTLPGLQKIQNKVTEARNVGDQLQAARYSQELMYYMKENNCNPMKSMIVPLCQAPIFISFFFGLKRMTNLPVDSMREGGLWWFTDLTVTDPYYILPIMTSATLAVTLKMGIDGPKLESMGMVKYIVQAIPLIILPFTINFPSAIAWYWVTTNVYSLIQVSVLKVPKIREICKIPKQIEHPPSELAPKKAFKEGFKESWGNMKTAREMADRQHLDTIQFNKFGRGPLPKTYSYNPVEDSKKRAVAADKR